LLRLASFYWTKKEPKLPFQIHDGNTLSLVLHYVISKMKQLSAPISYFVLFAFIITVASCSKSSSPTFPGVYYGTIGTGAGGNADTITITGGSSSSVIMLSKTSIGSVYTINGIVSGTSLNIPTATFLYNGATDTVSGSGSLNGSTLNISYRFAATGGVNNYTFTGYKQ
jgi:hypothetical protein